MISRGTVVDFNRFIIVLKCSGCYTAGFFAKKAKSFYSKKGKMTELCTSLWNRHIHTQKRLEKKKDSLHKSAGPLRLKIGKFSLERLPVKKHKGVLNNARQSVYHQIVFLSPVFLLLYVAAFTIVCVGVRVEVRYKSNPTTTFLSICNHHHNVTTIKERKENDELAASVPTKLTIYSRASHLTSMDSQ